MSDDVSEASSVYRVWCLSWDEGEEDGEGVVWADR